MPKPLIRILTKKVFIIANVSVAMLFLLGCYAEWIFTKELWFIGLFTLAAFYLLIILFLFFIFWLSVRSKWSLLFIIILIAGWRHIIKIIPLRTSADFALQKQNDALRIMSWNVAQFDILNYKKHRPTQGCHQ